MVHHVNKSVCNPSAVRWKPMTMPMFGDALSQAYSNRAALEFGKNECYAKSLTFWEFYLIDVYLAVINVIREGYADIWLLNNILIIDSIWA